MIDFVRHNHEQRAVERFARAAVRNAQVIGILILVIFGLLPAKLVSGMPARVRGTLRCDLLNRSDYEDQERGYYEQVIEAGRRLGSMGEVPRAAARQSLPRSAGAPFEAGPLALPVNDLREFVLRPNLSVRHEGVAWSTNALGMRDGPCAPVKPPGTVRIALVGDSIAAGWGVDDGQGLEPRLERVLDTRSRTMGGPAVEVLNFAVPGHSPGARWDHFSRLGWELGPDVVIFEATEADLGWDERRLRGLLPRGIGWDSPLYRDALRDAAVRPDATAEVYKRDLRPYRDAILAGVYRAAAADCRARGVPSVWVLIPRVGRPSDPARRDWLVDLAHTVGFSAVLDLSDAYGGMDPEHLTIGPDDYHPNAEGHALLARRLDEALGRLPELRRRWAPGGTPR